jgi:predicted RNase H-like HicB family nuclease
MQHSSIIVRAFWDDEAGVWVASSSDISGLSVEAKTLELLNQKVLDALTDLIEVNGFDSELSEIPVHLMAEQFSRISVPSH